MVSEKKEQAYSWYKPLSIILSAKIINWSSNILSSPYFQTFSKTQFMLISCITKEYKCKTLSHIYGKSSVDIVTFVLAPGNCSSHNGIFLTTSSYEPRS